MKEKKKITIKELNMITCFLSEKISKLGFKNELCIKKRVVDNIAVSVLNKMRNIIILVEGQNLAGVESITRSIFESSKNMKFIIMEKDTIDRARSYDLSIKVRLQKLIGGYEQEKKEYEDLIRKCNPNLKRITPDSWRSVCFIDKEGRNEKIYSMRDLCIYLDGDAYEYDKLYTYLCLEAHGVDLNISSEKINDMRLKMVCQYTKEVCIAYCEFYGEEMF